MSQNTLTQSRNFDKVKKTLPRAHDSVINLIAAQLDRSEDAAKRIEDEGLVVRDLKGAVIPHPAILIEANATKMYLELLKKWS